MRSDSPCVHPGRRRERGYILVPIIVMLTMVLAAVYAATIQGSVGMESTSRAREARQATLVAQSGLAHAIYEAGASDCANYSLPTTAFGPHSYTAAYSPTSGSPVSITATATLASGVTRQLTRPSNPIYESVQEVLFLQPGPEGKDTAINSAKPAANHGTDDVLEIETAAVERGLLEFDLSGLPANAVVRSATLELYVLGGFVTTIEIHRVTRPWVEGSCTGSGPCTVDGATWDTYDGAASWTTRGGDFDPVVAATTDVQFSNAWVDFDVSALVSSWHEGVANHGMLLYTNSQWLEFASSDHADATLHPKLTIEYSCECDPNPAGGTVVLQPGPGFGKDVLIRATGGADANYGSFVDLWIDDGVPFHSLIQFDLSNLPSNAIVTNAQLEVYLDSFNFLPNGDISVHAMTAPWTEGSGGSSGLTPADGATWNSPDGSGLWTSPGGDYDPTELDRISVFLLSAGWYDWDVTSAVSDWKQGIAPNYGLILTPGGGPLFKAHGVSSDSTAASFRPKLTVSYFCPCGADCEPPATVGGNLLMVVADPANLTTQETTKLALMESWGYVVSLIDESAAGADYEAALPVNDVVFVSKDVTASRVGDKLSASPIGVVAEDNELSHELGLAQSIAWTTGTEIEIRDVSHYITSPLSLGDVAVFTSSQPLAYLTGGQSEDLDLLASVTTAGGEAVLVAVEQGGERWDELASLDARRVQLPWGSDSFDLASLNDEGRTLYRRALEWAATTPSAPGGYLDRFRAPTCDPAIDLTGSDGALNWSSAAWVDAEDGTFCNGDAKIQSVDYSYRLMIAGTATVSRPVSLAGFSFGTVRFRYKTNGPIDSSRYLGVDMSDDGGTSWTEIGRIDSESAASDTIAEFAVTTDLNADSMIRFRAENLGATRSVWIDDLAILDEEIQIPFVCTDYYRDTVPAKVYTGDDGTLSWSTDWLEINESDGPTKGDLRANGWDSGFVLYIKDNAGGGAGLQREADLSSSSTATLKFLYRRRDLDSAGDYVTISASSDGGASWTILDTFSGPGSDSEFIEATYPLDDYVSSNTRIRFLGSPNLGDKDYLYIDDVEICLGTPAAASP